MSEYDEQGQLCEECKSPSRAGHSNNCSKKNTQTDKTDAQINEEQKTQEQKPRKLTPEESFKTTVDVFKDALDPKAAVKKVKDFFRK